MMMRDEQIKTVRISSQPKIASVGMEISWRHVSVSIGLSIYKLTPNKSMLFFCRPYLVYSIVLRARIEVKVICLFYLTGRYFTMSLMSAWGRCTWAGYTVSSHL